jgi:hypothetical protein
MEAAGDPVVAQVAGEEAILVEAIPVEATLAAVIPVEVIPGEATREAAVVGLPEAGMLAGVTQRLTKSSNN